jgi:selenide,water dikinase
MISQSNKNCELNINDIPIFEGLDSIVDTNNLATGSIENIKYLDKKLSGLKTIDSKIKSIICDAQTSGGLLLSTPPKFAAEIIGKLNKSGHKKASIIGSVTKKKEFENKIINFIN